MNKPLCNPPLPQPPFFNTFSDSASVIYFLSVSASPVTVDLTTNFLLTVVVQSGLNVR